VQGLLSILTRLGAGRLAAMAAVTAALVAFFAFVILRFSEPTMSPLFTGLDIKDSSAIVQELESSGIQYEIRGDGSTIMVPQEQVARLRMTMAENGLPAGGGVGYEIFDKGDSLSATSFVQNINQLRALEGELARSIRGIDRVDSARVHLVIPERALFQRDREPPSASIVLKVRGDLDAGQIRAIRHLIASAVEGLKPDRVSIIDEAGRLLADGAGSEVNSGAADERQVAFERRLNEQVTRIVESVVGAGRARVQITAELDFNKVTQTQDLFDPDSRVVRSTQTREETSASNQNTPNPGVTVGNQLPGANAQSSGDQSKEESNKTEETVNYEISRTTKTEIIEGGRVKRVSVAVLVDGVYQPDASGNVAYAPRAQEDLDRITALVRSAIGFDQQRGDQVEVVNLRFAEGPAVPEASPDLGLMGLIAFTKDDIVHLIEMGVLAVLSLLVLLFVVRPLVRRVLGPEAAQTQATAALTGPGAGSANGIANVLADSTVGADGKLNLPNADDSKTLKMLEIAQINGDIQQKSVDRIGELVERNPTETMSLIRTWLNDAPA
jgi:flagellar M-ring protein FliF